jgi:DNA recombination protein RmuC
MIDYIIIILLVISIIISAISLYKNINESNITDRLSKLEISVIKEINNFKETFSKDLREDFVNLNDRVDKRLISINEKVNERIDENFEKTNKTFTNVLERLTKIDEAQKKIDSLSTEIVSLQEVLTDKKSRGIFGEVNLKNIMASVFGDKNDNVYRMQYQFETGVISDAVLFAPEPLGTVAIDSKFPLENYQLMLDKSKSEVERNNYTKLFKQDFKKHIDAISDKYIITGVTSDQAIMFLPAEAIFAEVNAYHPDLIEYSHKKRVWITSPTTLISTLTTIQVIIKNLERDKYATVIHQELKLLSEEFERYRARWDKLSRSIDTVSKDVKDLHITGEKITKRFNSINEVEIKQMGGKENE